MWTVADAAPNNPDTGDLWYDTTPGQEELKQYDGSRPAGERWQGVPSYVGVFFADLKEEQGQALVYVGADRLVPIRFNVLTDAERNLLRLATYDAASAGEVAIGTAFSRVTPRSFWRGLGSAFEKGMASYWQDWAETTVAGKANLTAEPDIAVSDVDTLDDGDAIYRTQAWAAKPDGDFRGGFDFSFKDGDTFKRYLCCLIGTVPSLFHWSAGAWVAVELAPPANAQRANLAPANPEVGDIWLDTSHHEYKRWDGAHWVGFEPRPNVVEGHWLGAPDDGWSLLDLVTPGSHSPGTTDNDELAIVKRVGTNSIVLLAPRWDEAQAGDARYGALKAKRVPAIGIRPPAQLGNSDRWDADKLPENTVYRSPIIERPSAQSGVYDPYTLLPTDFAGILLGETRVVFDDGKLMTYMAVADSGPNPDRWQLASGTTPNLFSSNVDILVANNWVDTGFTIPEDGRYPFLLMNPGSLPATSTYRGGWLRVLTSDLFKGNGGVVATSVTKTACEIVFPSEQTGGNKTLALGYFDHGSSGKTLALRSFDISQDDPTPLSIQGAA